MAQGDSELRAGEYYHFYNRGHNRGAIFFERKNYLFFLRRVGEYLSPVLDIVTYCLMPTHYHLLIRLRQNSEFLENSEFLFAGTSEVSLADVSAGVSKAMQRLGVSYTKAINRRYDRVGALFQGAYRYKHIRENEYLVHLSRYIHLNPVIEGLAQRAEDWEFSSFRDYVGLRNGTLAKPGIVLSQFASANAYAQFVESYVPEDRAIIARLLQSQTSEVSAASTWGQERRKRAGGWTSPVPRSLLPVLHSPLTHDCTRGIVQHGCGAAPRHHLLFA